MKLHPRPMMVKRAEVELSQFLLQWAERHGLTGCEMVRALTEQIQMCLKYMLRAERHPEDPNKKADGRPGWPAQSTWAWLQVKEMRTVEELSGPVAEFQFVLEELHRKAEAAVLHKKPDRWDYYLEMLERLTEWFRGVGANDVSYAGAALALSQKAADECPLLARHEAVRLWALGVYARRILRTWGACRGARPSLEWFRRRAASVCLTVPNVRSTECPHCCIRP